MNCCQCEGIEREFNAEGAARKLEDYQRHGLSDTTRWLIDALVQEGVGGLTVLDIGGGVGGIQHALLAAGAASACHADASSAYLAAAKQEARRRGLDDRIAFLHGDFVALAGQTPPADIVTLDRVICCYHDMPALVSASAQKARRWYGLVYPRDAWWTRWGTRMMNAFFWMQRSPFRVFAHPTPIVESILSELGFHRRFFRRNLLWQVVLFERSAP